jgi:hypothetical protein
MDEWMGAGIVRNPSVTVGSKRCEDRSMMIKRVKIYQLGTVRQCKNALKSTSLVGAAIQSKNEMGGRRMYVTSAHRHNTRAQPKHTRYSINVHRSLLKSDSGRSLNGDG